MSTSPHLRLSLVLALCAPLVPVSSDAHLPATVEELARSRSVQGTFVTGDEVFTLAVHLEAGVALPVDVLVPPQSRWEGHRPALRLTGPGLPAEGYVDGNTREERPVVYENSTRRIAWSSGAVALPLGPGDYEVTVWSPEGTVGDFAVGLGVDDDPLRRELVRVGALVEGGAE